MRSSKFWNPVNYFAYAWAGGMDDKLQVSDRLLLKKVTQLIGAKPWDVINITVRAIRHASKLSKLIGDDCMSVLMLPGDPIAQCRYHSLHQSPTVYAPWLISEIIVGDIQIFLGSGVPPWNITDVFSNHKLTKHEVKIALDKLPTEFRTGDDILNDINGNVKSFLLELPSGLSKTELLNVL